MTSAPVPVQPGKSSRLFRLTSTAISILLAVLFSLLLPAGLKVLLRAELSWLMFVIPALVKITLSLLALRLPANPGRIFRVLSSLATLVFAAAVLTGILITPYSAYGIWFLTVRDGEPHGVVSTLFVLLSALFSTSFAALFLSFEVILALYGELLAAAGLLALVYQAPPFYLALVALLALGALYLSIRYVQRGYRWRNLVVFLLIFAAVLGISRLVLLAAEPRGSRIVDEQLHPGLRQAVVTLFPRFPLVYGIPGFGFGFSQASLGGTPVLSEAPIFSVQAQPGEVLYLRTSSYALYDGRSWDKSEALPGPESMAGRDGTAGRETPAWPGRLIFQALGSADPARPPAGAARLTLLAEYYNLVPHTLTTRVIYLLEEQIEGLSGNPDGGFQLAAPLRSGQSIYLVRQPPEAEPLLDSPALYLQLPDVVLPELAALARSLADAGGDTRTTLRNIERYLARNYTYNLEVKRSPAGEDFVEHFLFRQREGYCVHFASSFVVLCRLAGIPARYATGFLVHVSSGLTPFEDPVEPGRASLSGLSSHAWPEVWLEDRGWTAWEATTAVNPAYYEEYGDGWVYKYALERNRLTQRQLRAILGKKPGSPEEGGAGFPRLPWQSLLLLPPLLAAALVLAWFARRYAFLLAAAARPDRSSALKVLSRIVRSQVRRGVDPPRETGWERWACRVKGTIPEAGSRPDRLLAVVQRLVYSDHGFRKRDLRYLSAFYLRFCRFTR